MPKPSIEPDPVLDPALTHLLKAKVKTRDQAVHQLARYPRRRELKLNDVVAILNLYPPMNAWSVTTMRTYLQLADELTSGLASHRMLAPSHMWLDLWQKVAQPLMQQVLPLHAPVLTQVARTTLPSAHNSPEAAETAEAANACMLLAAQGLLPTADELDLDT